MPHFESVLMYALYVSHSIFPFLFILPKQICIYMRSLIDIHMDKITGPSQTFLCTYFFVLCILKVHSEIKKSRWSVIFFFFFNHLSTWVNVIESGLHWIEAILPNQSSVYPLIYFDYGWNDFYCLRNLFNRKNGSLHLLDFSFAFLFSFSVFFSSLKTQSKSFWKVKQKNKKKKRYFFFSFGRYK